MSGICLIPWKITRRAGYYKDGAIKPFHLYVCPAGIVLQDTRWELLPAWIPLPDGLCFPLLTHCLSQNHSPLLTLKIFQELGVLLAVGTKSKWKWVNKTVGRKENRQEKLRGLLIWVHSWSFSFLHPLCAVHQVCLWTLSSKYLQNPNTSYHLHCNHPGLNHPPLLYERLGSLLLALPPYNLFVMQPSHLFKAKSLKTTNRISFHN